MDSSFSVTLKKLISTFNLEVINLQGDPQKILIYSNDVNRPGLQLAGFYDYFDSKRIQVMGKSEMAFLESCTTERHQNCLEMFFSAKPPAIIVSRGMDIPDEMVGYAKKYEVPLLRVQETTSTFSSSLISLLNVELAPRITRHGVFIEVYGEGVLILGDSGVGKSETAVELIKRGHRLVADDAVELRQVSSTTIVGSSPENIRHFLELRGIGIINARKLFGISSVKMTEKVDMVIHLEPWDRTKDYDRLGMENRFSSILGIHIPSLTIPVNPGRNLAIIIEVAAMNNRQKKMGYNSARELMQNLGMSVDDMLLEPLDDGIDIDII